MCRHLSPRWQCRTHPCYDAVRCMPHIGDLQPCCRSYLSTQWGGSHAASRHAPHKTEQGNIYKRRPTLPNQPSGCMAGNCWQGLAAFCPASAWCRNLAAGHFLSVEVLLPLEIDVEVLLLLCAETEPPSRTFLASSNWTWSVPPRRSGTAFQSILALAQPNVISRQILVVVVTSCKGTGFSCGVRN